jgi:hypothetical protein
MVAAMDKVGVDSAIFISAFSMYQYDAGHAVEVQQAHPGRFPIVKPVNRALGRRQLIIMRPMPAPRALVSLSAIPSQSGSAVADPACRRR